MKILLKVVVLGAVVLLYTFCPVSRDSRIKKGSNPFETKVNITTTKTVTDRSEDPVMRVEAMVREMRNSNPRLDMDSIRRQRNVARAANIGWIKESTARYSPDSWDLLMKYDKLPMMTEAYSSDNSVVTTQKALETFEYLRGRTRLDLLASMETNVHEVAHAYFDQNAFKYIRENNLTMNWEYAHGYIYVSPSKGYFITYPLKNVFPSRELLKVIPKDLQTFRFGTYIDGTTSTQSEGIIGLLNELYAYYTGSKYCFEMLEPYKTAAGSDASGLFEWASRTQSTMSAFYEFDFFISEYLLYMKTNYPQNYEKLKSYKTFAEAFITIRDLYEELIERYQQRIRDEIRILNSSGETEAKIEKGWLWVRPEDSNVSSGTPIFSEEKETLLTILESRRYRDVEDDFKVD